MTAAICGLQRRNAYNFREHGPAWYRCWWLPMVYRGCRGALCPPLKFNYQAHWVFNSSLILFGWRLGRCSNCHPGESLERAGQERLWWRSVDCRCGGQDGRVMTRWAGLQHPALADGPTSGRLFRMSLHWPATTLHKMKLDPRLQYAACDNLPTVFQG